MANQYFNDSRSSTTTGSLFSLTSGDILMLGTATLWTSINGTALAMGTSSRLTLLGQLYGNRGIAASGLSNTISIGTTGMVAGVTHGIDAASGGANVNNQGYVSGSVAMNIGQASRVINSGTIAGLDTGITGSMNFLIEIVNSGTITANNGISFSGGQSATISNSGSILSALTAIRIEDTSPTGGLTHALNNTGYIVGTVIFLAETLVEIRNTGTIDGNVILGSADDFLDSSAGHLFGIVSGNAGDDRIIGSLASDRLQGGDGDDILSGGAGDDRLTGGTGTDLLDGGDGIDTAVYSEVAGVTADLQTPTLNTGEATGDRYVSIENISGSVGNDRLSGDTGANRLTGNSGDDILNGRGGDDVMVGGFGDDIFYVDTPADRVIEREDQGVDTVFSTALRYTLPDHVEELTLIGNAAIDGTGNGVANVIIGNDAANVIAGRSGNDALRGGGGADIFVFDTKLSPTDNVDLIEDFTVGEDKIQLSRGIFTALNGGKALRPAAFTTGAAATDAFDRIIYDRTTGALYYDADGNGAETPIPFAQIGTGLALTATDFILVA